ncbi:MAG: translocation/assembly module TamB [Flavobacteriales bacterium]|nr:translocation/assembly module TamB [Flavobacteriales bacterium]
MGRTLHFLIEFILLLVILLALGIRTSWFQTYLAQQAAAYLSGELGTEVSIDKVDIVFFDRVELEGIYVEDVKKDTLLYTESIFAEIDDWSLSESFVDVEKVELNHGRIYLRKYEGDSTLNFQHIVDYFASEEPDTSKSSFGVNVQHIWLEDIEFVYQDQNAEKQEHGMDYANIHLHDLSGGFSDFGLNGDSILVNINQFQFKDRSGLILSKLSSEVLYCPEVVSLKDLKIGLNNSWLLSDKFQLKTPNGASDWSDFVHKVIFDANLRNSKVSLSDVAYFVPAIYGMTDEVTIHNIDITQAVFGMKLKNFHISMLDETVLKGEFVIPNLDNVDEAFFQERINLFKTSIADVKKLNLSPFLEDGKKYLEIPEQYNKAGKVRVVEAHMDGYMRAFTVDGDIYSGLGNVHSANGLSFYLKDSAYCRENQIAFDGNDTTYYYEGILGEVQQDVIVDNLDLGAITANPLLGMVNGYVRVNPGSKGLGMDELDLDFTGNFDNVVLNGYDYHDINIYEGRFANNRFTGKIDIEDDNLALNYDGFVDLNNDLEFDFDVKIDSAHLAELTNQHDSVFHKLEADVHVNMKGNSINSLRGVLSAADITYHDGKRDFELDTFSVELIRTPVKKHEMPTNDTVLIHSKLIELSLTGIFDLEDMHEVILNQLAYVADNLVGPPTKHESRNENFDLDIELKNINPLLQFFDTDLYIAKNTEIRSEYDKKEHTYVFDVNSDSVTVGNMKFIGINIENHLDSTKGMIYYQSELAQLNDSTQVRNLYLDSYIKKNRTTNTLGWDGMGDIKPALFAFVSDIDKNNEVRTQFKPSFFYLQDNKWKVSTESEVVWNQEKTTFSNFKIEEGKHSVSVNGVISKDPKDWLRFAVKDFDLADLNGILEASGVQLDGVLNIKGGVADVYNTLKFSSDSKIKDLYINNEIVGDLEIGNKWIQGNKSISMRGKLKRDGKRTFGFKGNYFVERKKDNIVLNLTFDKTDIGFLKAFEDPELYTDIDGILDGNLKVTGELANPVVKGKLNVEDAHVFVPMFNVGFGLDGNLQFDKGEISGDFMKLADQEGNEAILGLSIYHYDWQDWNYDIGLDMESGLDRFLALNTKYKEGEFYYGKAYVSGWVNISGYGGKTTIEVDATTQKGTDLVLPMYGNSELEESSFLVFKQHEGEETVVANEAVQRSGLELIMNFGVTRDANVKIVFDPVYEDQITSKGEGDLEIKVDEYGEVTMFGQYVIREGDYNMRMKNVVNKDFTIVSGSSLTWTRSPYDADIDIQAEFIRNVSLADIMPDLTEERTKKDEVHGFLIMSDKLMSPDLSFDITAPKADELGKGAINELKSNVDMLNKQFFSLLMLNKFLPTHGGGAGGAGASVALGLAENQINAILGNIGENYDLAVDLKEGQTTLETSTQINEKISITTSFGVVTDAQNTGSLVGDVSVDYKLNDDGTFTVNFFNESNTGSEAAQGPFTQGVGLHYQEEFNTTKEFKLLQGFLNIFRKPANKVDVKRKRDSRKTKVPD